MCYFNPSASSVVFNPLLFSRGVITIHLDVLDGDVVALALFVYYYILVLFICNLRQTRNSLCFSVTKSS